MARSKKKRPRGGPPARSDQRDDREGDRNGDLTSAPTRRGGGATAAERAGPARVGRLAGWSVFAIGASVAVADPGSPNAAFAAVAALAGVLVALGAGFWADLPIRAENLPRRSATFAFPVGTLLVLAGAAMLLYPTLLTAARYRELAETFTYAPLVAVAFAFSGIAVLIDALDRAPPSEAPFALETRGGTLLEKLKELDPRLFFIATWQELDREAARAREARAAAGQTGYDWRPLVVLLSGAVLLSLMEYFGHAPTFREILDHYDPDWRGRLGEPETLAAIVRDSPFRRLLEFAWWSGWRVLGFFLLPAFIVKVVLRQKIADHGLQTRGFLDHAWIYALAFAFVLGLVILVSYEESFQSYYPFYKATPYDDGAASRSWFDFWAWELLYAAQFFSLEFFFRGFWLKAAKPSMGSTAIFAMVVPYCMIHFGKPFPETLGAIAAGVALGTLALRTRSIWSGFLIHVSVAISMDVAALLQTTGLPDRWWPAI